VESTEQLYPDRLGEHIDRLAHHAARGELWGKALMYLRQAGAKAFARSASREALAYFEQAIPALAHLPETRGIEEGVSLLEQALTAHESAGVGSCHSMSVVQLGEAHLLADRIEDAPPAPNGR
jgi:predicted ATPase